MVLLRRLSGRVRRLVKAYSLLAKSALMQTTIDLSYAKIKMNEPTKLFLTP